ncbi:MAG: Na+/H+ antiporter subunit G [Oceanospirillales bacterium]|uniref:Multisubunit potassium/proton antiporter PhaG subunit n=1 Tax=Marinobacterium halophilum TaxID=267374 RepID=A0A2P8ESI1_9GAMM|nr:Na+/H+ antiporter subunit G [Marinobacterium halophilum]MBR9828519.1 Na+/H+ antiporter subunit G [Oceanospirillales bacterium]PSL12404.1 multisubunit potassium/proton antiporter PhaG subunit [Marinobacterium halophilum]
MNFWVELLITILLLIGGVFVLVGSIGLCRLPDIYTRLHAPTKATTVGMGGILLASMLLMSTTQGYLSLHELLITLFLLITAPITAHMLAKTALHHENRVLRRTRSQHLMKTAREQQPPGSTDHE